jgi:hypothetical protein
MPKRNSTLALLATLASGLMATAMAKHRMPPLLDEEKAARSLRSLPSVETARFLSLGYHTLAADYYWIQAVQYFGSGWNQALFYRDLFPLVDLVSRLDPRWEYPLLFGGVALPTNLGRETWINTAESTVLLERGTSLFPDNPDFYVFAAYNLLNYHNDAQRAGQYLMTCARLSGCPAYVPQLATRVLAAADDVETALAFAQSMLESNEDPSFNEMMKERVRRLELERDIVRLETAVTVFKERNGRTPVQFQELLEQGILDAIPEEGYGGEFLIDAATGEVSSSTHSQRLRPAMVPRPAPYE